MFPCHWNYRPDHCIYGSNCAAAEHHGVYVLHGNRGVYHDDKQPAFRAIYEAIQKVSSCLKKNLVKPYKQCYEKKTQRVDSYVVVLFNNMGATHHAFSLSTMHAFIKAG